MNDTQHNESCKRLRVAPTGLWSQFKTRLGQRCSAHIAVCPRCQRRLARIGRVETALCLMRMQPHSIHLTAKANTAALKYLKRSLRQSPRAETLRQTRTEPSRLEKTGTLIERLVNVAACLFVILMIRSGLTHKMFEIKEQGTKVMESYYARNMDDGLEGLYEDLFGHPPEHKA